MDDEGLRGIQHLNSVYRPDDGITGGQPSDSTTPIHHFQGNMPQSVPAASSCLSKSIKNNNSSLSFMMLNDNSTKDGSSIMNTYSKPSTSNMTPLLSNMFQTTNTLQSSNSNSSTNQRSTQILNNPNLRQMPKSMNILDVPPQHMNPHHYPYMPSCRQRHHYPYTHPYHHPHHHPNMHPPSRPMHSNDDRPTSQAININIYAPPTMPIQPLNIPNVSPGGPQSVATDSNGSFRNVSHSQQRQIPLNDPRFSLLLNYFKAPTPNLNDDGGQQ
jgi:hypothetical protein